MSAWLWLAYVLCFLCMSVSSGAVAALRRHAASLEAAPLPETAVVAPVGPVTGLQAETEDVPTGGEASAPAWQEGYDNPPFGHHFDVQP